MRHIYAKLDAHRRSEAVARARRARAARPRRHQRWITTGAPTASAIDEWTGPSGSTTAPPRASSQPSRPIWMTLPSTRWQETSYHQGDVTRLAVRKAIPTANHRVHRLVAHSWCALWWVQGAEGTTSLTYCSNVSKIQSLVDDIKNYDLSSGISGLSSQLSAVREPSKERGQRSQTGLSQRDQRNRVFHLDVTLKSGIEELPVFSERSSRSLRLAPSVQGVVKSVEGLPRRFPTDSKC